MFNKLVSFFENELKLNSTKDDPQQAENKRQMACAVLLIEIAKADEQETQDEIRKVREILQQEFSLSNEQLEKLVSVSETEGDKLTSVYPFTALINEHYEYADKVNLIKLMWRVAYADGDLSKYEDHLIRKVADLIYLSHRDFIQTKLSEAQD